jgi:phosphoribosylaminoimidazolecarboxamide formyltransferase/IMP cyclohydrolase
MKPRVVVFVSGSGSNLQAILDACASGALDAEVVAVVSNRKSAYGLVRAAEAGVPTLYFPLAPYKKAGRSRDAYDTDLAVAAARFTPDLIVLAGWMHILSPAFLQAVSCPVLNLHPALPGAFPGTHAIERALDAARAGTIDHTGVMVHHVVPEIDAGPVVATARVPIHADDTLATLSTRMHAAEHILLVQAVATTLSKLTPPPEETSTMTRRALLSVWDKSGLVEFGTKLASLGFELVASGGTARKLREAALPVVDVSDITGHPEILGGRVKTLHPAVHGGLLARGTDDHLAELAAHGIAPIDVVVCNLYPFEGTVAQEDVTVANAVEEIDIGGVTLLRAAAKNFERVLIVSDPTDYDAVLEHLEADTVDATLRRSLALKAFTRTAAYDTAIATWMAGLDASSDALPAVLGLIAERSETLRYGENPHQVAAVYRTPGIRPRFTKLQGKAISYNNLIDLDSAWAMPAEFQEPCVAIIKHNNPCGLAVSDTLVSAFEQALASDPVSAFGSVIAVNRPVDGAFVRALGKLFVEVLAAPAFTEEAQELLAKRKKNCRVMVRNHGLPPAWRVRHLDDGFVVQTADDKGVDRSTWTLATERAPTPEEADALAFAWIAAKHTRSNAIIFGQGTATVGIGAGQMSRVDSVRLAAWRAGERSKGAVMSSDAFFPFADGIEAAAEAGVTAVIQPGGSIRDDLVIEAANKLGLAMVFTGTRHFKH